MATISDPTTMPRVLVAEDDPAIRRLLATTLRRRRLEVELAEDGAQAQQALERGQWDVLVMDLMMPYVNGWDLVRWLGAHPERRPGSVIVVSAADRDALRELDPGIVNAIIFKPFDVVQLGTYVKNAAQRNGRDRRRARSLRSI
jgi:CheY-like chemotaxis protein